MGFIFCITFKTRNIYHLSGKQQEFCSNHTAFVTNTSEREGAFRSWDRIEKQPSFPGGASGKEPTCQCRRREIWIQSLGGKIPWRRVWQLPPVSLPGKSHRQEPGGLQSMRLQRVGHRLKWLSAGQGNCRGRSRRTFLVFWVTESQTLKAFFEVLFWMF